MLDPGIKPVWGRQILLSYLISPSQKRLKQAGRLDMPMMEKKCINFVEIGGYIIGQAQKGRVI